jgi:hypothetical protein
MFGQIRPGGCGVKRLVFAAMCVSLVLPAGSALAYEDSGSDPDDRSFVGDPDIRSTVRTVWTTDSGRALRVTFRAYERLGKFWSVTVLLDARGGPKVDHVMNLWNADQSGRGCDVYPRGQSGESVPGGFDQRGDTARCRVPTSLVHPTKRIRWKLRSPSGYVHAVDIAPNGGGWFG